MKRYKTPIKTDRFVYHISPKMHRESILQHGLLAKSKRGEFLNYGDAVFAHNSGILTLDWYPLCLDHYEWSYWDEFDYITKFPDDTLAIIDAFNKYYDLWRIDTESIHNEWLIDDVGEMEFNKSIFKKQGLYIVTFNSIPPTSIERCEVKRSFTEQKLDKVNLRCNLPIPVAA